MDENIANFLLWWRMEQNEKNIENKVEWVWWGGGRERRKKNTMKKNNNENKKSTNKNKNKKNKTVKR